MVTPEQPGDNTPAPGPWRVASRWLPARMRAWATAGRLRLVARVSLLAPERIQALARLSFWLLLASGIGFALLDVLARLARPTPPLLATDSAFWGVVLLALANGAAYLLVLPVHEALHALVILLLGGRPTFGVRMPYAIYCTAPGQLFSQAGYTAVALAPLVVLTLLGVVVTALWPNLGAYLWLAFVGNVSGAVGDLVAVGELRRQPRDVLIADTGDGFDALAPESD